MSINMDRVGLLLHVITEAAEHGPNFRDIMSEANIELTALNEIAREDGINRVKAKADADASAKADEAARAEALAAEAEAKLKADVAAEADAKIKAQAHVVAVAQAKAEILTEPKLDAQVDPGNHIAMPEDAVESGTSDRRV